MVKIAVAGASGEVAREVVDALVAAKKHDIVLLSRKQLSAQTSLPNVHWVQVDYSDKKQLVDYLRGVNVVLSFITTQTDPGSISQKNLIDACVQAGVKRFAPSEWATSSLEYMEWYSGKGEIREYLKMLNKNEKESDKSNHACQCVLEYTLFQPGLFTNYLTHPHRSATHVTTFETQFDFQNRRFILPDRYDDVRIVLTTAQDLANVVARAVEYEGEWPVVGGIKGCELSLAQLVQLGEEIRGKNTYPVHDPCLSWQFSLTSFGLEGPFDVETLRIEDLKTGVVKSSWLPHVSHAAIPPEQANALAAMFLCGMTLAIWNGALNVSDEWNRLLPDYKFTQPRELLSEAWSGGI